MASASSADVSPSPLQILETQVDVDTSSSLHVKEDVPAPDAASVESTKITPMESADGKTVEKAAFVRIKKRNMVLMLSYCGQGYFGMQKNPGTKTIEAEFFDAMLNLKYVDDHEYNRPQSFGFQRAARTDKNVSAARQIISFKGPETLDIHKLNELMPPCIRIMGMKRVTRGFDAKQNCDARTYSYMIPTFAFAPLDANLTEAYRITPEVLANVRKLFKNYIGTKNFHNFTSKKRSNDPSAMRHILSFDCADPFVKDGLEYVVLRVKGQSFMLHQIRKMIGLCTAILRGFAHEDVFQKAFGHEKIDVPKAPGLGLMLEEVHYSRYDTKFGSDGVHESITWDEVKPQVEKFCEDFIYPIVTRTENEEKSMWNWLATLVFHAYDVREHDDPSSARTSEIGRAFLLAAKERGIEGKLNGDEEDVEQEEEDESKPKRKKFNEK